MTIKLTPARRSQLLEQLLKANAETFAQNPQTGWETGLKLMAQAIRQGGINRMQQEESQTTKVRGANEAAAIAELLGEQPKSVFGTELPGQQAPGAMRQHLMTQNPESGYGPALAEYAMRQQLENQRAANKPPRAPTTRTVWDGKERVQQEWNPYTRKWTEVGRGEVAGGVEVNVNYLFSAMKFV